MASQTISEETEKPRYLFKKTCYFRYV